MTDTEKLQYNYLVIRALLISQGMPENTATWAAAQVMHETNGLKSRVSKDDNNLSGIMWINKPYQNATRGTARPRAEGGYYARYADKRDWAKDFIRVVSFGTKPVAAASLQDYVNRLADNKYFTDSRQNYYNGVKRWLDKVRGAIPVNAPIKVTEDATAVEQQPYNITNPEDRVKWFDFGLSPAEKKGLFLAGAGVLGLLVVLSAARGR